MQLSGAVYSSGDRVLPHPDGAPFGILNSLQPRRVFVWDLGCEPAHAYGMSVPGLLLAGKHSQLT